MHAADHRPRVGTFIEGGPLIIMLLWPLARARAMIGAAAAMADYFFPSIEDARALSGRVGSMRTSIGPMS